MARTAPFAIAAAAFAIACKAPVDKLEGGITIEVVDEAGAPVTGAQVVGQHGDALATDSNGRVELRLRTAELVLVTGPGMLDEPVVLGRNDAGRTLRVKLWRGGGTRWAMHSAGDVMFARRFQAPTSGVPLIPPEHADEGARHVVEAIAPAFVAADLRTVNLETVVSSLGDADQYPGKRFILNSPPPTVAALDALGVDAIDLANNHGRDYFERGIDATHETLAGNTLSFFGEANVVDAVPEPLVVHAGQMSIGMIGWTSVDGAFVNDAYPLENEPVPSDLPPEDKYQYEERVFGYEGITFSVAAKPRRLGTAWRLFKAAEPTMSRAEAADAWTRMSVVYPELQDWVQRRGHPGAALWESASSTAQISALAPKVDMVVVQLHAGFQFQAAPSAVLRTMARQAIDAGAGIVICHHPHVIQGAEWYKGKLILYSLGNFVFDQDFATTFPSMFLRTVWDGTVLLEARLLPLDLVGYRPIAVADEAANRTLRRVWEMSVMDAIAERDNERAVRVFTSSLGPDTVRAHLRAERNSAVITDQQPTSVDLDMPMPAGAVAAIPTTGLVNPRVGADLEIGRELLGWGNFEDNYADGRDVAGEHWNADSAAERPVLASDAATGVGYLQLVRSAGDDDVLVSRPVARVTLVQHRLFDDMNGEAVPLDPDPRYTVRLHARTRTPANATLRIDLYNFDDTDPTEDPQSIKIGRLDLPLDVQPDGEWHVIEVAIDPAALIANGLRANQLMPYVQLAQPSSGKTRLDVDDLEILEWRRADGMPDRYGAYDYVRNIGTRDQTVRVHTWVAP